METKQLFRVDLHSHTNHSQDAVTRPLEVVERAQRVGLDRIAVTDHGTIEGALRAREAAPHLVIVGEEIRCRCRTELIGLFLEERIPMRLPLEEVVERIRDQSGVIYAPHPYAYPRKPITRARRALAVADVVEACNARAFLPIWNRAAVRSARERGLATGAGSDAHFPGEIGRAYTWMPEFQNVHEFRAVLEHAIPVSREVTGPAMHVASFGLKVSRVVADFVSSPLPAPSRVPAEQ
jgi:predicted metal-dependent phosphoesterase TrpH